jgi:hypothetical protein
VAVLEETAAEVAANEACTTGNDDVHGKFRLCCSTCDSITMPLARKNRTWCVGSRAVVFLLVRPSVFHTQPNCLSPHRLTLEEILHSHSKRSEAFSSAHATNASPPTQQNPMP